MMRKWEYTAKALERLGAPAEIIEAAKAIDEALVKLGIDYNTPEWRAYCSDSSPKDENWNTLNKVVTNPSYCSACITVSGHSIECENCELSHGHHVCTPSGIYGKNLFKIVNEFISRKRMGRP